MAFLGTLAFFRVERKHARLRDMGYDPIRWLNKGKSDQRTGVTDNVDNDDVVAVGDGEFATSSLLTRNRLRGSQDELEV